MQKVKIKEKGWIWKFSFGFANNNYTALKDTIWYPKGFPPSARVQRHERMHLRQQEEVGFYKYLFLYLLCAPFLYNKNRWKWEYVAYTKGSGWSHESTVKMLRSKAYGWLRHE